MSLERQRLSAVAQGFCDEFKDKADIDEIFLLFASSDDISVIEHGEPPFCAAGIRAYFETVQGVLTYENLLILWSTSRQKRLG
jgi:hypothetical protein